MKGPAASFPYIPPTMRLLPLPHVPFPGSTYPISVASNPPLEPGSEVGLFWRSPARSCVGVAAVVSDEEDGVLQCTCSHRIRVDGAGCVDALENDAESDAIAAAHAEVWADLQQLLEVTGRLQSLSDDVAAAALPPAVAAAAPPAGDAAAFSFALADAVEISAAAKQALLEEDSTLLRLMKLGERVSDGLGMYRAQLALRSLSV